MPWLASVIREPRRLVTVCWSWLGASGPAPHEWLLLLVLLGMTHHFFWLMDDAFIYFRYIDNLLFLGRGLVWNAGEFVEGFSSPAWLLCLIPLRALQLDYYSIVHLLSLAAALGFGVMLIWINRQLSPRALPPVWPVSFPLAASAAHYGIVSHLSSGLETPLVQLFAAFFAAAVLRPRSREWHSVIALSPLVRPELALVVVAYAGLITLQLRCIPWFLIAVTALVNGTWLAFRVYYYADFLPNTFYLKDGEHWRQGLYYFQNVLEAHHWPAFIALLCALALSARRWLTTPASSARWPRTTMLAMAALYMLYVVRIGGDMLYHRYASFSVCLGLCASAGICEAAMLGFARERWRAAGSVLAALGVVLCFGLGYPAQLDKHPLDPNAQVHNWNRIADPMWHRRHPSLRWTPKRAADDRVQLARYAAVSGAQRQPAKVVVNGWCRSGYVLFDTYVVHAFGLTDAILARLPAKLSRPGHKQLGRAARALAALRRSDAGKLGPAVVDGWLARRRVPSWIKHNAPAIRLLERKSHNRHDFFENLALARTSIVLR